MVMNNLYLSHAINIKCLYYLPADEVMDSQKEG